MFPGLHSKASDFLVKYFMDFFITDKVIKWEKCSSPLFATMLKSLSFSLSFFTIPKFSCMHMVFPGIFFSEVLKVIWFPSSRNKSLSL